VAAFARIAAVFVGLANAFLHSILGDGELGNIFIWNLDPWWPQNFLYAICAILSGLAISGILLTFARQELQGNFFARYGLMVLAVCLGGALFSGLLTIAAVSLDSPLMVAKRLLESLHALPFTVVAGGVLGAAEGVILAFPLADILGRFREG
jgi:hypothetical protein